MSSQNRKRILVLVAGMGLNLMYAIAHADSRDSGDFTGAAQNAWLQGKLETTYLFNRHLNNFEIDTRVENGTAYLQGAVESEIDKALAAEVAFAIDGIDRVENRLTVDQQAADAARDRDGKGGSDRAFAQKARDATTTASVKLQLLANEHTSGMSINVDTRDDVVTLRGQVDSAEEKMLAERLAANTDEVKQVRNELEVSEQEDS